MVDLSLAITVGRLGLSANNYVNLRELARQLNELLSELGDVELEQARRALSDAQRSDNPERELSLAVGHLQSASGNFHRAWTKEEKRWFPSLEKMLYGKRMEISCYAEIAVIYHRFAQPSLVQRYADEIRPIFLSYCWEKYAMGNDPELIEQANKEDLALRGFIRELGASPWEAHGWVRQPGIPENQW